MKKIDITGIPDSEEEEGMMSNKRITDPDVILIIIAGFIWFIMRPIQPNLTMGQYDFLMLMLFVGWLLYNGSLAWLKHKTPKLIADPIHTTTVGYGEEIGMYTIFTMDDIRYGTFEIRNKRGGTIIVPTSAVSYRGRNIDLNTPLKRISPNEIPFTIRRQVLERGYKPPFWRGYVSDIQLRRLPKISKLIEEVDSANEMANMLRDEVLQRFGTFEKFMEFINRGIKMSRESTFDKLKSWLKGGNEE